MKTLPLLNLLLCLPLLSFAQTVVRFDMDETAGTNMTGITADVGSGTWSHDLTGVATNGSGALVNSGNSAGGTNLDIADLSSGIYEFIASDVVFNNIGGGSDDVFGFAFRSFSSTATVGSSSSDSVGLVVGNINSSGTLDAILRIGGSDAATVNDFASISGTYSFIAQYDLDNDTASFFYDSGSGRTQIGSTINSVTGAANFLGFSHTVVDFGGGDNIEVGGLELTAIPEPSTVILVGAALGALAIFRRRN